MPNILMPTDIVECRVYSRDGTGGEMVNVYNYEIGVVTGGCTDYDFAFVFDNLVAPYYKAMYSSGCYYDGTEISIVNRSPMPAPVFYNANTGLGANTFNPAGNQVAGVISWITALAGRKYRGRNYIGGVWTAAYAATGLPTSPYITAIGQLATQVFTLITISNGGRTAACTLGIRHRLSNAFTAITGFNTPHKFGTQRRRSNYGKNRTPPI
jgi:hypothetical protein